MDIPNPNTRHVHQGSVVQRDAMASSPMSKTGNQVWNGMPLEGPVKLQKETDPEPIMTGTPHARVFDFSKKGQIESYEECLKKIASNNNFELQLEDRQFSPVTGNFVLFLRYNEYFYRHATKEDEHDK